MACPGDTWKRPGRAGLVWAPERAGSGKPLPAFFAPLGLWRARLGGALWWASKRRSERAEGVAKVGQEWGANTRLRAPEGCKRVVTELVDSTLQPTRPKAPGGKCLQLRRGRASASARAGRRAPLEAKTGQVSGPGARANCLLTIQAGRRGVLSTGESQARGLVALWRDGRGIPKRRFGLVALAGFFT